MPAFGSGAGGLLIDHVMHVEQMEGASMPPRNEIEREALVSASRARATKEDGLHVLAVSPDDIKPGTKYTVDLKTRTLVEIPVIPVRKPA